ncbi:MAG: DUF3014 domain-containing protein [Proteobacteria bacterium]|nr:DUF3014 domain-containing protein [Pseudomonadota bacterium]
MHREATQFYIPILLAIMLAAALTYYWLEINRPGPLPEPVVAPALVEPLVDEPRNPLHPFPRIESPEGPGGELVSLPSLDQSDEYLKLALADVLGSQSLVEMLAETNLIARMVATIDNLPRDHVAERIRPIAGLPSPFDVEASGDNIEFTISPDSYRRYDLLVDMVTNADLNELTEVYGRFYPLFQKAYVELGYPNAYFNDRLVAVIDHLLTAPVVQDPISLVRPHVLYEFADMDLESLSSGQKLLIRMGNEHATRIKATLSELRLLIADQNSGT